MADVSSGIGYGDWPAWAALGVSAIHIIVQIFVYQKSIMNKNKEILDKNLEDLIDKLDAIYYKAVFYWENGNGKPGHKGALEILKYEIHSFDKKIEKLNKKIDSNSNLTGDVIVLRQSCTLTNRLMSNEEIVKDLREKFSSFKNKLESLREN